MAPKGRAVKHIQPFTYANRIWRINLRIEQTSYNDGVECGNK